MSIKDLRDQLTAIDRELIELVARRQQVVSEIGRTKQAGNQPTRDFSREREVLELARRNASELGVPEPVAETLMGELIRASLTHQEQTRVVAEGQGSGQRALVIGGAGKMGRWFGKFLASQGFAVEVADPAPVAECQRYYADWRQAELDHDLVVVATPLGITAHVLAELAELKPAGLILDIGSLKTPLRDSLKAAAAAGCNITSVHPMFGPDTELLSGRHVIFVDCGCPDATRSARALFASTMAELLDMELDEHDRLIAYVLGLSHVLNIAFFTALTESRETAVKLARMSSTTFDAQLEVSAKVAGENPALYFEIQAMNEHGGEPLQALERAVTRLRQLVEEGDEGSFATMMLAGRDYLRMVDKDK